LTDLDKGREKSMTVAEIIILIIGAILFTVSFIIPEKKEFGRGDGISAEEVKKAVKSAVDEEVNRIKDTIDDASNESINDSKDKMERYMDRITNEKMMAVSEYSDTVLEQIHKDHEEAVFLYDMIDSKYKQVKNTAAELTELEKTVKELSKEIPVNVEPAKKTPKKESKQKNETVEVKDNKKKEAVSFEPINAERVVVDEIKQLDIPKEEVLSNNIEQGTIELMFDSDSNSMNNNDRILALHKEGKSNMAIAKELGLGVGEVKLVIDLFKN